MDICGRDDLIFFLVFIYFLDGKMDICGRDNLFFGLHLLLNKTDICRHDDPQRTCPTFA